MYLGIDLGTSGVKVVLLDDEQQLLASQHKALCVSHPKPLWSEQNPDDWWHATISALDELASEHSLSAVKAIGLTGQMHGATLLDKNDKALCPAILWNDGRSYQECLELEQQLPNARTITGNLMMAGFTAPKLKWLAKHQPETFTQIHKILLPKDYLRLRLSGNCASDMSDAAGTMWLDVGRRDWSDELLAACQLDRSHMPRLFEGNQITGELRPELAQRWQMPRVPIVAGGGDNAAGAIGVGLHQAGQAMLSLGTSGVYFVVTPQFLSNPTRAVHSFCHALPNRWHLMSVMLSAASAVDWAKNLLGFPSVAALFAEIEQVREPSEVIFLPYLSGERTPHNDPKAKGMFWGMSHRDQRVSLAQAVVEGVSFGLSEGMAALHETGVRAESITLIGGGAKSALWRQLLADITGKTLEYRTGGEVGPALGAAKLAQMAVNPQIAIEEICRPLPLEQVYEPNPERHALYQEKQKRFAALYQAVKALA